MLLFWISLIVLAIIIILVVIAVKRDSLLITEIFGPALILGAIVFVAVSISECFSKESVEGFNHKYSIVLKKIDTYTPETDFELLSDLYKECKDIDYIIKKNAKLYNSIWRGNAYSEEIGNTPSIVNIFNEKFNHK